MEQLSGVLGVDSVSVDVGLDAVIDVILTRAEQLLKNDTASAAEQKSQMYALKRKLKTMKEQLDGKVSISLLIFFVLTALRQMNLLRYVSFQYTT